MSKLVQASMVVAVLLVAAASAYAGVEVTPYGYIKLDASFDSAMTNDGDYVYVVLPYAEGEEDDEFNMTAKQTRLGLKLRAAGRTPSSCRACSRWTSTEAPLRTSRTR
jgi:hypothetical protein